MFDVLDRFRKKYALLEKKGLKVEGLAEIDSVRKYKVINVSKPFIFDNRELPKKFEGIVVKKRISGDLPDEFTHDTDKFIWSPDRYEKFVDRCGDLIKEQLGNPDLTRTEMLDAVCFGDFNEHKVKCDQWVKEGRIKPYGSAN
ncbi:MAG: hypothetical protein KDC92_03580 [Bacteroidetes bacterium]|nr:hypothetical protein [Bacteroidota bacterium]